MSILLRAALIVFPALTLAAPAQPTAIPLSQKNLRRAEASAKTPEDHVRLARYYRAKVEENQRKLAEAEHLVGYWAQKPWMVYRNKVPNPYQSAKARLEYFRRELRTALKLASAHERAAEELRSH